MFIWRKAQQIGKIDAEMLCNAQRALNCATVAFRSSCLETFKSEAAQWHAEEGGRCHGPPVDFVKEW